MDTQTTEVPENPQNLLDSAEERQRKRNILRQALVAKIAEHVFKSSKAESARAARDLAEVYDLLGFGR